MAPFENYDSLTAGEVVDQLKDADPETLAAVAAYEAEHKQRKTVLDATRPRSAKMQGQGGAYYLVNPAGAVHGVDREHARWRLATAGWRMATEEEIARYRSQRVQRHDRPIAAPWSPDAQLGELE